MVRRVLFVAIATLALSPASAAIAGDSSPPTGRPHARLATYLRNGLRVERLQATFSGANVRVRAAIHNDLGVIGRVVVRVASCESTVSLPPRCSAVRAVRLQIETSQTRSLDRTFRIGAGRGVEVAVTQVRVHPRRRVSETYGVLLVGPGATRRTWGLAPLVDRSGTSVQRVALLLSGISGSRGRASVAWSGRSETGATLTTQLGGHAIGDVRTLPPGGAVASFFDRPYFSRNGDTVQATVTDESDARLAEVLLPFPLR